MKSQVNCDHDPAALSIDDARQRIVSSLTPVADTENLILASALHRVLAHAVQAPVSLPPFRASAMDGYAVRSEELTDQTDFRVAGTSLAGHPWEHSLAPYSAVRVTTGARVPDDADAVIPQEDVVVLGDTLRIDKPVASGHYVRDVGTDTREGSQLLAAGSRLGPAAIALLHAHGLTDIEVVRPLKVALFSTGDELLAPGEALQNGKIHDANRPLLQSMLAEPGFEILDLGICPDEPGALRERLESAQDADLIISSGGVSVGDADHMKEVVGEGGEIKWWKVAMKPGRPLAFGHLASGQPWFGLPGNPVSAAITTLMFVRPAIDRLMQRHTDPSLRLLLPTRDTLKKAPGRVEFQRGQIVSADSGLVVTSTGSQESHVLSSLSVANCLIELPLESAGVERGDAVLVHPLCSFSRPLF